MFLLFGLFIVKMMFEKGRKYASEDDESVIYKLNWVVCVRLVGDMSFS